MKRIFACIAAFALAALVGEGAHAQRRFEGVTLRVNSFGGAIDESFRKGIATPLKEKHGIDVTYVRGITSAQVFQAIAAGNDPPYDIMLIDSPLMPDAIRGNALDRLPIGELANAKDLLPGLAEFEDWGLPFAIAGMVIMYNTERVKEPPRSYADLTDPRFRNKVGIFNLEATGGQMSLVGMIEGQGGNVRNAAPGFELLRRMRPNLVSTPPSIAAMMTLFEQNEIDVGIMWNGRVTVAKNAKQPFDYVIPREGFYSTRSYLTILRGGKNKEAAKLYVDQALSAEAGLALAEVAFYAPTNAKAVLPPALAQQVIGYGPEAMKTLKSIDWAEVSRRRAEWTETWNREVAR